MQVVFTKLQPFLRDFTSPTMLLIREKIISAYDTLNVRTRDPRIQSVHSPNEQITFTVFEPMKRQQFFIAREFQLLMNWLTNKKKVVESWERSMGLFQHGMKTIIRKLIDMKLVTSSIPCQTGGKIWLLLNWLNSANKHALILLTLRTKMLGLNFRIDWKFWMEEVAGHMLDVIIKFR